MVSVMTSEDEGLGDDTRRDLSSGPSSLADLQECEFDAISQRSMTDERETNHLKKKRNEQNESTLKERDKERDRLVGQVFKQRDAIDKLEKRLEESNAEKESLKEQVLELEEAENDARLMSQRLEQQLTAFTHQYDAIRSELIAANKVNDINAARIKTFEAIESKLRFKLEEIKNILMKGNSVDKDWPQKADITDSRDCSEEKAIDGEVELKSCWEDEPPIPSLYAFLWEKLYRIETQIDCLQQNFCQTNDSLSRLDSDDDLQLFISSDTFNEDVTKIGSSFDANQYNISLIRIGRDSDSDGSAEMTAKIPSTPTPLCDTIKPERIDIGLTTKTNSSSDSLPSDLLDIIYKLEINENNLKQRLTQLESINKEFVREIETREKLFFQREQNMQEYLDSQLAIREQIDMLKDKLRLVISHTDIESAITSIDPLDVKQFVDDWLIRLGYANLVIRAGGQTNGDPPNEVKRGLNRHIMERVMQFVRNSLENQSKTLLEDQVLESSHESATENCGTNSQQSVVNQTIHSTGDPKPVLLSELIHEEDILKSLHQKEKLLKRVIFFLSFNSFRINSIRHDFTCSSLLH